MWYVVFKEVENEDCVGIAFFMVWFFISVWVGLLGRLRIGDRFVLSFDFFSKLRCRGMGK